MDTFRNTIAVGLTSLAVGVGATYGAVQKTPLEAVADAQERYKAEHGKYFQCNEYKAKDGDGYQIIYFDAEGEHSIGTGVEAAERTYTIPIIRSATST